ncbi:DUF1156 domain-containing protein (plasmid) [Synechocystis sp. B12]|nr:DUF1156 domain-containing protein [Synechocystis sp. B12]
MTDDRRLIEDFIPIKEIFAESAREKSIRKGHISTLHLWWARRPLVASRAAVFASLVAAPENHQKRSAYKKQMIDLCQWKASEETIKKAQKAILEAQRTRLGLPENTPLSEVPPPKVLDMFAGVGQFPWRRCGWVVRPMRWISIRWPILLSFARWFIRKSMVKSWRMRWSGGGIG